MLQICNTECCRYTTFVLLHVTYALIFHSVPFAVGTEWRIRYGVTYMFSRVGLWYPFTNVCLGWLKLMHSMFLKVHYVHRHILDDVLFQSVHSLPNCFQVQNGGHPSINWTFQKHPFVILKKWLIVGKYVGFFVFQFVLFVVFVFRVLGICCLDVLSVWSE